MNACVLAQLEFYSRSHSHSPESGSHPHHTTSKALGKVPDTTAGFGHVPTRARSHRNGLIALIELSSPWHRL